MTKIEKSIKEVSDLRDFYVRIRKRRWVAKEETTKFARDEKSSPSLFGKEDPPAAGQINEED